MTSDDYKSVDIVKQALGSIARLGRAAAVHLALACQRASGSTISTDLKNNIQMSVLLGGFDDGASQLMFEKDISQLAKPQIKGRGFIGSGNEIIETQTYYTQPENDWMFDEDQKLSYNNPVFVELCKRQGKNFDELNTGWVPQHKIGEEPEEEEDEIEEEEDEFEEDEDLDEDELFKDHSKIEDSPKTEAPPKKDEEEPVTFKFGGKKSNDAKPTESKPVEADSPDLGLSGLEAMFGPSNTPVNTAPPTQPTGQAQPNFTSPGPAQPSFGGPSQPNFGQPSNRERIGAALNQIPGQKPQIKLNIDKTTADQPMAPKPTIKLNIKPKNPTQ